MLDFPGHTDRIASIQQQFSAELKLAKRMFSSWMCRPIERWLYKSDLPGEVTGLSWMLNTQACRQFRSVVELCRIGEAENANALARGLFETVLASYFVLAPKFHIVVEPRRGKSPKRDVLKGKWHARVRHAGERCVTSRRKTRALLYMAHCVAQSVNVASTLSADHLARTGEELEPALDPRILSTAKNRIGRKWKYIQGHQPYTYSGLSVKGLADAAGHWFPDWYRIVYPDQSRHVHGVDPVSYVGRDKVSGQYQPAWFSNDLAIGCVLYCANMLFFSFTVCMNENVDMGNATEMLLDGYMDELKTIYGYAPVGA